MYQVYQKIRVGKIEWPHHFDSSAKNLIKGLLVVNPEKRFGSGNCGIVLATSSTIQNGNTSSTANLNGHDQNDALFFVTESELASFRKSSVSTKNYTSLPTVSSNNSSSSSSSSSSTMDHLSLNKNTINMGSEEVKQHKWFVGTNWSDVFEKKLTPPDENDTVNFTQARSTMNDQLKDF